MEKRASGRGRSVFPSSSKPRRAAGGGACALCAMKTNCPVSTGRRSRRRRPPSGTAGSYLEKYVEHPRHIEFQVLGDEHGNVVSLGERECSIQRRHQKLLEESPSVRMTPELRKEIGDTIGKTLSQIGYHNAGTIEFLMDEDRRLYFIEMNTRIQVEHPVHSLVPARAP